MSSLMIVLSFISVIPVPQKYIPVWDSKSLRYFCPMLALSGLVFGALWLVVWLGLSRAVMLSSLLRGFIMMLWTLALTGGLHIDGLMDSCDAIFSRKDRAARLEILSDTHAGSFAVMGCVIMLLGKTLLFAEMFTMNVNPSLVPVLSRFGMAVLLNNLPFAKNEGLAVMLGSSRRRGDNLFFAVMMIMMMFCSWTLTLVLVMSLVLWSRVCLRVFGGITGDLLGACVENSELVMMIGLVISECI